MRITVTSTSKIVTLNGVPARIWEGRTDSGVQVHCYVTRISPRTHDPAALSAFATELDQCAAPSPEVEALDPRFIL